MPGPTPAQPETDDGVSILLPFRNAESTLEECLDSIQQQTFQAFELLAIDDHSSDSGHRRVREQARQDPRIRLLTNPGRGLVEALNFGLRQARHSLIARMDADDRMLPQRLQLQYDHLNRHPSLSVLGSQTRLFPDEAVTSGAKEYLRWQNGCITAKQIADNIYMEAPFAHPSVMFRRAVILRAGGYRQGPFPEDYDLWLRLHQAGKQMAKLPHVLLEWREGAGRTSRTDPRCSRDAFDRLRAHYLSKDPLLLQRRGQLVIWGAGRRTRKRVRHLLDRNFRPMAWIDIDPRKIGNRLDEVPVRSPAWLERQKRKPLILCYVARHGAREQIAAYLNNLGYQSGSDYLMIG